MQTMYLRLCLAIVDLDIPQHCPLVLYSDTQVLAPCGYVDLGLDGRLRLYINQDRCQTWRVILSTLIHEICHACIRVYICDARCGLNNNNTSACFHWMSIGRSGHG